MLNERARRYNNELYWAFNQSVPGQYRFLPLVEPNTGFFVNNRRADTPTSFHQVHNTTRGQWLAIADHYKYNWAALTVNEMRTAYRVHLGTN